MPESILPQSNMKTSSWLFVIIWKEIIILKHLKQKENRCISFQYSKKKRQN